MLANAMVEAVGGIIFVTLVAVLIASSVVRIRNRRREERVIRRWCDDKGYAVSRLESFNIGFVASLVSSVAGPLLWWVPWKRGWRLGVYDDEGGQATIVVRVRRGLVERCEAM